MRPPLPILLLAVLLAGCGAQPTGGGSAEGAAPRGLGGLFAPRAPAAPTAEPGAAADAVTVAPGQVLPPGQVVPVCGLAEGALGRSLGTVAGFTLYDSDPTSVALRNHFLTGFQDDCPRQFSAALALFGDPETHELLRYLPDGQDRPYSATDRAYEEIKADLCGVPAGQPCGNRMGRLTRRVAFVTVYESFGTNEDWSEILLFDGQVAAVSNEGG